MMSTPEPPKPASERLEKPGDKRGLLDAGEKIKRVELKKGDEDAIDARLADAPASQYFVHYSKLVTAGLTFAMLVAATYIVPGAEVIQPWRTEEDYIPYWNLIGREILGQGKIQEKQTEAIDALEQAIAEELREANEDTAGESKVPPTKKSETKVEEVPTIPPYVAHEDDADAAKTPIEFADALDPFFLSLTRTDLGIDAKVTRVSHWGDSVLGNDGITAAIRFAMQGRFGDSGHGFHAITQYDPSYRHKGIRFREITPWNSCYVIQKRKCGSDKRWGYGGNFGYTWGSALSEFRTEDEERFGRSWSSFELWYAGLPGGGALSIQIDGASPIEIPTESESYEDRWEVQSLTPGAHRIRVRAQGGGPTRAYGVVLEDKGPGVVWDGMALIGSFTSRMSKQEPEHIRRHIAHRDPDLFVLTFGGNDMLRERSDLARTMKPYERDLGTLVDLIRSAKPSAACLIMSPIDHGERIGGRVVTRGVVPRMVEAQRRVAKDKGCAFFDTYQAMGGEGSIGRWFHRNPRLASGDLAHPTSQGHKVIGRGLVYRALMDAYRNYRGRVAGQPWPIDDTGNDSDMENDAQVKDIDRERFEDDGSTQDEELETFDVADEASGADDADE